MISARRATAVVVTALALFSAAPIAAQDLEPRAYAANPVGAAFLLVGWTRSTGAVVTDPTLPISDVNATIKGVLVGAGYTFDLGGKTAQLVMATPYAWGDVSGKVFEQSGVVSPSGLADSRLRFAVNLRGNDAVAAREFLKRTRQSIVGVSLTTSVPTGQYYGNKLVNLGNRRWAFKPEVGVSVPRGKWDFDGYAGVWLFLDNTDYFPGGATREQSPLTAVQGHAAYTFKPQLWMAFDGTWYAGGETTVGDNPPGGSVNNVRLGATLSVPAGRLQSIKIAYSTGATVRSGTDFRTVSVAYSRVWLTKL